MNNKLYIGQTKQKRVEDRWKNGKAYRTCTYLHRAAIQKYGWDNFEHTILEEGWFTKEQADDKECYWISYYDSRNQQKGYNVNPGGYRGISPLATQRVVEWMKVNPSFSADRVRDMHKWQNENPEEMLRYRRINARKAADARRRKVQCLETGVIYESATVAAKNNKGTSQAKICMVCRGQRKTCGGYKWRYINE